MKIVNTGMQVAVQTLQHHVPAVSRQRGGADGADDLVQHVAHQRALAALEPQVCDAVGKRRGLMHSRTPHAHTCMHARKHASTDALPRTHARTHARKHTRTRAHTRTRTLTHVQRHTLRHRRRHRHRLRQRQRQRHRQNRQTDTHRHKRGHSYTHTHSLTHSLTPSLTHSLTHRWQHFMGVREVYKLHIWAFYARNLHYPTHVRVSTRIESRERLYT